MTWLLENAGGEWGLAVRNDAGGLEEVGKEEGERAGGRQQAGGGWGSCRT